MTNWVSKRTLALLAIAVVAVIFQNCSGAFKPTEKADNSSVGVDPNPTPAPSPGPGPGPGPSPAPGPMPAPAPSALAVPFAAITNLNFNPNRLWADADRACTGEFLSSPGVNKAALCSTGLGMGTGNVVTDVKIVNQGQACPAGYQQSGTLLSWQVSNAPQYQQPVCLLFEPAASAQKFVTDLYGVGLIGNRGTCAPGDVDIGSEQFSTDMRYCARVQARSSLPVSAITSFVASVPSGIQDYQLCPQSQSDHRVLDLEFFINFSLQQTFACPRYASTATAAQVITEVAVTAKGTACPAGMVAQGSVFFLRGVASNENELCVRFTPTATASRALQKIYFTGASYTPNGRAFCRTGDVLIKKVVSPAEPFSPESETSLCARF